MTRIRVDAVDQHGNRTPKTVDITVQSPSTHPLWSALTPQPTATTVVTVAVGQSLMNDVVTAVCRRLVNHGTFLFSRLVPSVLTLQGSNFIMRT